VAGIFGHDESPFQCERIVQVGVGIDGDDRRAHDRIDTRVGRQITGHFAAHKVAIGGDSDELPGVDDGWTAYRLTGA
jgi:hypothetical protein